MAGEWGTREEFLHPRDSHGRFRKSWKMAAAVIEKISAAIERFNPKTFNSQEDANNYVRGLAQSDRFNTARGAFMDRFLKGYSKVNTDLRAGKTNPDVAAMDKAMRPLPNDLILSRTVGPEAFGLDASNINQLEEYTGKLVADKGYSSTNIGMPHRRQGGITMVIQAPAGTKAVAPSVGTPTSEIILDRDQPFRITKVRSDGQGGYYVMAVATEKGGVGQTRTKSLGTAAPTPKAEEINQPVEAPGQAPQAPAAPQAPQAPAPQQTAPVRTGKPGRPAGPPPAPRNEPVHAEAIGGNAPATPQAPETQRSTPNAPEAPATPETPPTPEGEAPQSPDRRAEFREAFKKADIPVPGQGPRRATYNKAYLSLADRRTDPNEVVKKLDHEITLNDATIKSDRLDGTDSGPLPEDNKRLKALSQFLKDHFGLEGAKPQKEESPAPAKAAKKVAPKKSESFAKAQLQTDKSHSEAAQKIDNSDLEGKDAAQLRAIAEKEGIPTRGAGDDPEQIAQTIKDIRFKRVGPSSGFKQLDEGAPAKKAVPLKRSTAPRPTLATRKDELDGKTAEELRAIADKEGIPVKGAGNDPEKIAQTIRDIRFKRTQPASGFGEAPAKKSTEQADREIAATERARKANIRKEMRAEREARGEKTAKSEPAKLTPEQEARIEANRKNEEARTATILKSLERTREPKKATPAPAKPEIPAKDLSDKGLMQRFDAEIKKEKPDEKRLKELGDELDRRDLESNEQIKRMSDDDLEKEFQNEIRKDDLDQVKVDRLGAELDRRDHERAQNEKKVDALMAKGRSYRDAYAEVHNKDPEKMDQEERAASIEAQRRPGETREATIRRLYEDDLRRQYVDAENVTRGHLLTPAGRSAGIDPKSLFQGNSIRSNKWASDELKEYWEKNPRKTYTQFKADLLKRPQDVAAAKKTQGIQKDLDLGMKIERGPRKSIKAPSDVSEEYRKTTIAQLRQQAKEANIEVPKNLRLKQDIFDHVTKELAKREQGRRAEAKAAVPEAPKVGAPAAKAPETDIDKMTIPQLRAEAKRQGTTIPSSITKKADILEALKSEDNKVQSEAIRKGAAGGSISTQKVLEGSGVNFHDLTLAEQKLLEDRSAAMLRQHDPATRADIIRPGEDEQKKFPGLHKLAEKIYPLFSGPRFEAIQKGAKTQVPTKAAPKPPNLPGSPERFNDIGTRLKAAQSREEAQKIISDEKLTVPQLRALADSLNIAVKGNKTDIQRDLVHWTVGRRLDAAAVSKPGDTGRDLRKAAGLKPGVSTKPILPNHWGTTGGEINYHEDGKIGTALRLMGREQQQMEVPGEDDNLANVLGRLATRAVRGDLTQDQLISEVKKVQAKMDGHPLIQRSLAEAVRDMDSQKLPVPELPDGTPPRIRKLMTDLNEIPLARRDRMGHGPGTNELDRLADIMDLWSKGKLTPLRLISELQRVLFNNRHESEEGKFQLDRVVQEALKDLEKLVKTDRKSLYPPISKG